jgi:opacity protein-like surface antigen
MFGARLTILTLGLVASLAANAARAADYYQPPPQPVYIQPPPVIEEFASAWYLRGDVGLGMMRSNQMEYIQNPATPPNDFKIENSSIGNAFFVGGGVGYEFNNWLRFDGTAEYRSKAPVYAFGSYVAACNNPIAGGSCLDTYQGYVSSWVFLANAYVDLGTWNCFTPFVGAGIGAARNTLSDFTDVNVPTGGRGIGRNTSEWHPAWALHAGVAYNVTKNFKVELAYRYLDLGSVSDSIDCIGGCNADSYKFNRLTSQDIKLGLRWTCCDFTPPPRYVYTPPPPVYPPPPPLRSKG